MTSLALRHRIGQVPGWIVLLAWAAAVALPLYILIVSCFKTTAEIYNDKFGLPSAWTFQNFISAWTHVDFGRYLLNSLGVTGAAVVFTVLFAAMAAYPLSRYELKWASPVLAFFLAGIMLPIRLASVELFTLMKELGLLDSRLGLVFVYVAIRLPFAIFIFANFMRALPRELEEAARIDGAGEWRVLFLVILPIVRPAVAIVAIFTAIAVWNDFFFPLIFIFDQDLRTVPFATMSFIGQYRTEWGEVFASLALSMAPVLLMYVLLARQIREGVGAGGGLK
ncbi:carbohydrate ABC transporter permease [Prosthecomicrobium pneumaticum]|uniref:Raffinose/stachyose/melibiose transport system permease protein n=1 Tax=Prosthecomicrobium pneumaticum TaxID=81895 RepID=A0A7W9CVC3_9HYPH|nr:carbohydrate ABC transporter permease [Prosthecomicrobium pneumaticum]MBB5752268.1 raffinose/stachyose/melibiose transport system permease protein [Prosthecomicrobium pneumaticum]